MQNTTVIKNCAGVKEMSRLIFIVSLEIQIRTELENWIVFKLSIYHIP